MPPTTNGKIASSNIDLPLPRQELQKWLKAIAHLVSMPLFLVDGDGRVVAHGSAEPQTFCDTEISDTGVEVAGVGLRLCTTARESRNAWLPAAVQLLETIFAEIGGYEAEMESMSQEILARYEEVNLFYELSDELASIFEKQEIADIVLNKAREILSADGAWIFLPTSDGMDLLKYAQRPLEMNLMEIEECALAHLSQWCFHQRQNLLIESREDLARISGGLHSGDKLDGMGPFTAIGFPILVRETRLGVLLVARFDEERPFTGQDSRLASALGSMLAMALYNSQLVQKAKQEEIARKELEIAATVQQNLLPLELPRVAGIDLASEYIAANKVGGDYLDYLMDGEGNLYLVVADVSGHNIGAALLMASSRSVFRMNIVNGKEPARILQCANRVLYSDFDRSELFLSAVVAKLDPHRGRLHLAGAGHNPALLWRAAEKKIYWLHSDGFFIGLEPELEIGQENLQLRPDDVLILYTDGLVEAANPLGERYETTRLEQIFRKLAHLPARGILDGIANDVREFMERQDFDDDISVLVLKMREPKKRVEPGNGKENPGGGR